MHGPVCVCLCASMWHSALQEYKDLECLRVGPVGDLCLFFPADPSCSRGVNIAPRCFVRALMLCWSTCKPVSNLAGSPLHISLSHVCMVRSQKTLFSISSQEHMSTTSHLAHTTWAHSSLTCCTFTVIMEQGIVVNFGWCNTIVWSAKLSSSVFMQTHRWYTTYHEILSPMALQ